MHGTLGCGSVGSTKEEIISSTQREWVTSCGWTHCDSQLLKYHLRYDPLLNKMKEFNDAYQLFKKEREKISRMPPYKILSRNELLVPGSWLAIQGGKKNKYCAAKSDQISCNENEIGESEKFVIVDAGDQKLAFKGAQSGKYCTVQKKKMMCSSDSLGDSEKFTVAYEHGVFGLKPGSSTKFCSDLGNKIKCDKKNMGKSEKFTKVPVPTPAPTPVPALMTAVCPEGYDSVNENLDGEGKVWSLPHPKPDRTLQECANLCSTRDGCTGFEYANGENEHGACGTYTAGDDNLKDNENRKRATSNWYSCVKQEAN